MAKGNMKKKRWSAKQKAEVAQRVIQGESIEELSREFKIAASDIHDWYQNFYQFGLNGLKQKPVSEESKKLAEAQKEIGKLTMENELLKKKTANKLR